MDTSSFFGSMKNLINPSTPKAMLFIRKRKLEYEEPEAKPNDNEVIQSLRSVIKNRDQNRINKRMVDLTMPAGQIQSSLAQGYTDGLDMSKEDEAQRAIDAELAGRNYLRFEVQYNPSSIAFSTSAGVYNEYRAMGDSGARQVVRINRPSLTRMNLQLIFQDVNSQDAFLRENLNPSIGNIKDMAADIATKAMGDGYSVKSQVEGLVSLLTMENTRQVIFAWSGMFFHGVVETIDANYTMFNKIGNPIKATIDLSIRQAASGDAYKTDAEYWDKALDKVFKKTNPAGGLDLDALGANAFDDISGIGGGVSESLSTLL